MSKITLTQRFNDSVEIADVEYKLDLSFDNVLRIFELFSDDEFEPYEKVEIAIEMLLSQDLDIGFEQKDKLLSEVFKEFLDIDLTTTENLSTDGEKFFDLYEDAEGIYALFVKEYGIDLFDYQGKLHFKKFSALLGQAIGRDLKEVVGIRASKVPKPTKYNKDERDNLLKLKRLYKLKHVEDPDLVVEKVDKAWDTVANFFRPKGGNKDG